MGKKKVIDDGGPAFPSEQGHMPDGTWNQTWKPGMSLRKFYAGLAMQGFIMQGNHEEVLANAKQFDGGNVPMHVARVALEFADAMIAALKEDSDGQET